MEEIKFSDFRIIPDLNSVHREQIDDDTYFSDKYKRFISNSRLKWINPDEADSPKLFKENPKISSSALSLGSAVHCCVLQGDEFELAPKIGKPSAKLGLVFDEIDKHFTKDDELNNIIKQSALKIDYFSKSIDAKIPYIREQYLIYRNKVESIKAQENDKTLLILSDNDWDIANACIKSLNENNVIRNILQPIDVFGDKCDAFNEDALFVDFIIVYKEKQCAILPFKLKIDNWTINGDTMILSLNDLKTTGRSINQFMENSFEHYHYYRQLGCYMSILEMYANKEYGISIKTGWKFESNICAVETIPNYWSRCFKINDEDLHRGIAEFNRLIKMVGYYEIFGYDVKVNFI